MAGRRFLQGTGPSNSSGALRIYPPQLIDRAFGALFVINETGFGRAAPVSLARLFSPPGLFSPLNGVAAAEDATGGAAAAGEDGIFGSHGVRLPGVSGTTELAVNFVLAGLLVLGLLLLTVSAVPVPVVGRTPISIEWFLAVRPFFVTAAASILLSTALIYGLGQAVP